MNLTIGQIEAVCGGRLEVRVEKAEDMNAIRALQVGSVTLDSRQVTENGVFVATVGERVDGHKFIPEVFAKGAGLVITEKLPEQVQAQHGVAADKWGSYLLVKDSFQALKDIAGYYRSTLSIPVVGITGSVGKTSTKELIAAVLSEKYRVLKTEGNYNNEIGVPLTLLRIRGEHQAAVVEMGISDFGEMHRLSKMVRPNVCVITNIGQCHLENLGTRDGILKAKSEIFDFMDEEGSVCLNGEDDKLCTVTEVKGRKTHFFGLGDNPEEEVYASDIVSHGLWGSDALLHISGQETKAHIPLPGRHMVLNASAAACVGSLLGLSAGQIAEGIGKVEAVSGRNNLIRLPHYTLIDDCYNANPVSMRAAIDLLAMADGEKTAILGDMFELGENSDAMHAQAGAYAACKEIDRIYCVGEHSRHMYEGAKKEVSEKQRLQYFPNRETLLKAIELERENLIPKGNTVLIKASHGMQFTDIVHTLSCS